MLPITKLEREALFQQYDSIQTSFSMYDKNIIVNDGPIVYISIASNSNETNYIFRNLGLAEEANPHVAALIKLINSRLSEDNQMY